MLAKQATAFASATWAELLETLDQLAAEGPLEKVGFRYGEVTDLIQGQLFSRHPMLALRMPRVIELRFATLGAVAYLRTGIRVGQEVASPDAGAFLLAVRWQHPETGEYVFLKYPRVKRMPTWRQNLRRRLRDLADDLREGRHADPRREAHSLADLLEPETDDLEADLQWDEPEPSTASQWTPGQAGQHVSASQMGWGDLEAAGISLPVWISVVTSLGMVLAVLLRH